jgi:hypothetical protein
MKTLLLAFAALLAAAAVSSPLALGAGNANVTPFITDTLGGNGRPANGAKGTTFITDTLGGNEHATGANADAQRSVPPVGNTFSWGDAGVGAAGAAGALLALLGGTLLVVRRRAQISV